jgi:hypothetical protein
VKFLAVLLTFGGYVLVYAAVAGPKGSPGRFALNPWMGVFYDAYTYGDSSHGGGKIGPTTPSPNAIQPVIPIPGTTAPGRIPRFRTPSGKAVFPGR